MFTRAAKKTFALILGAGMIFGCGSARIPVSFEVPISLADNLSLPGMGELPAGTAIPEEQSALDVPVCVVPSEETISKMVKNAAGSLAAKTLEIDEIILEDVTLSASSGDFGTLTSVGITWNSTSPAVGEVAVGSANSPEGFGGEITLTPDTEIDLLDLAAEERLRPVGECPSVQVDVAGNVPEAAPVFSVKATVKVKGTAGL
jgi:hypothetical protein